MAWRCSGASNSALIENLAKNGLISAPRVHRAMEQVDRAHYSPRDAYRDEPQSIGYGATISAPHMHAAACEALLPYLHPGARVLDVGCGSGYLTHVLAKLVSSESCDGDGGADGGKVIGIDHIEPLVALARSNTSKSEEGRKLLAAGSVEYRLGDGRKGVPGDAFDAIHVGAASRGFPQALVEQLKAPGRMFVPVEGDDKLQYVYIVDKAANGSVSRTRDVGVRYVPLTDAPSQ